MNRLGKPHGSVGVSDWEGITSPAYWVMSIDREIASPRFVHHLLRSRQLIAEYERLGKWLPPNQFDISWETFRAIEVPLPPLAEQRRIADFLDAETARLDHMAGIRKRQLELIEEHGLRAVFDAIRGSSQPGTRRDSGLGWLGDIPQDWGIQAVSHQFEVLLGKMLNKDRTEGEHLRPYLRNTNVQWDRVDTSDLLMMDFPPGGRRRYEIVPGDLLICEGGEPGRAAIWGGSVPEIYYQKAIHRARPRGYSSVRWLYYCLRAATALNVFAVEGNTTTIAHLTGEQLRAHRFPFPERAAQDRMVSDLDDWQRASSRLAGQINGQVGLLGERRRALITAAVTGQIDVSTARGVDDS